MDSQHVDSNAQTTAAAIRVLTEGIGQCKNMPSKSQSSGSVREVGVEMCEDTLQVDSRCGDAASFSYQVRGLVLGVVATAPARCDAECKLSNRSWVVRQDLKLYLKALLKSVDHSISSLGRFPSQHFTV